MTKQQIIHHISKRLEFLINHSDGADRNLNADKITELSVLLRDVTMDDDQSPTPMGNTFTYDYPMATISRDSENPISRQEVPQRSLLGRVGSAIGNGIVSSSGTAI